MGYCDLDDIRDGMDEEEIIRYTDDYDTGLVNTSVTDKAIEGAGAMIDAHLATRLTVPVDPVPDILRELAVDIAIYKICSRRSQAPEEIRVKYEDAIRFLEKVASGKTTIPGASAAPASRSNDRVSMSGSDRIFSRDKMKGF